MCDPEFESWWKKEFFLLCKILERRLGLPRLLFSMYRGSFLNLEGPGRDVATHLHLASRLRKSEDMLTLLFYPSRRCSVQLKRFKLNIFHVRALKNINSNKPTNS